MSEVVGTSYDEVPYASNPFAQTHPDRLAVVATLFGMKPAPVARCRVLELGCASGGNLLPLAIALPESTFVGIDLSARQIAEGQEVLAALGLGNITLRQQSILDVGDDLGKFDYILCHGVFSWVPENVQEKILTVCAHNLAPEGVAYISYNTYPGWHLHAMIRDVMCYHAKHFPDPHTRVRQARALLDFLARSVPQENNPYGILLKQQVENLRGRSDSYLLHDHLEEFNQPIYFHQFAERAAARGLQYLGEAEVASMVVTHVPAEVDQVLRQLSVDVVHLQQYLDFLRNTQFRQSLLCHGPIALDRARRPERLEAYGVATRARPVSPTPDLKGASVEQFRGPHEVMATTQPLVKAAMVCLAEAWPRWLPFAELCTAARRRLGDGAHDAAEDRQLLATSLLDGYLSTRLIELHVDTPHFTTEISARPLASPLARYQAQKVDRVVNLRHEVIILNDLDRHVLGLLDGTHDQAALLTSLEELVRQGKLMAQQDGQPLRDADRLRAVLSESLEQCLRRLAQSALLLNPRA
jgi:methyltransferase-like protein/SAM-dependent methyltransferase